MDRKRHELGHSTPAFLDETATRLFQEGREAFHRINLNQSEIVMHEERLLVFDAALDDELRVYASERLDVAGLPGLAESLLKRWLPGGEEASSNRAATSIQETFAQSLAHLLRKATRG